MNFLDDGVDVERGGGLVFVELLEDGGDGVADLLLVEFVEIGDLSGFYCELEVVVGSDEGIVILHADAAEVAPAGWFTGPRVDGEEFFRVSVVAHVADLVFGGAGLDAGVVA